MFFLCIQPMLCFRLFAVCIRQLAHKMGNVATLLPSLGYIGANRSGCSPNLISQSIAPFRLKSFGNLKNLLLQLERELVNAQFLKLEIFSLI